jgi:desulfoferrodoxin (superoxide reductase-like protein)
VLRQHRIGDQNRQAVERGVQGAKQLDVSRRRHHPDLAIEAGERAHLGALVGEVPDPIRARHHVPVAVAGRVAVQRAKDRDHDLDHSGRE